MTENFLKKHCKLNKLYQTPHLNDVLYLHYKGESGTLFSRDCFWIFVEIRSFEFAIEKSAGKNIPLRRFRNDDDYVRRFFGIVGKKKSGKKVTFDRFNEKSPACRFLVHREPREVHRPEVSMVGQQRDPGDRQFGESERAEVPVPTEQPDRENREPRSPDETRHRESIVQQYTEDRESRWFESTAGILGDLDLDVPLLSDSLKFLNTLNLSHNYLRETADIEHLRLLDSLSILDISHNRIESDQVVNVSPLCFHNRVPLAALERLPRVPTRDASDVI